MEYIYYKLILWRIFITRVFDLFTVFHVGNEVIYE